MTAAQLVADLVAELATVYPAYTAALSRRPGRVTCVVVPTGGAYEDAVCAPTVVEVTVDIHILAAMGSDQGVGDLLAHVDPVAALVRAAGFSPVSWTAGSSVDLPEIVLTATVSGKG